ncbi:MAG: arylsulfatase [Verrucomicrobiota bacterium]
MLRIETFLVLCFSLTAPAFAADRPNVILFMADDMGIGDTSAYQDFTGNADDVQVATPNMERLARMGVRFTDAHTPSSRCSPTRYGLMTGRYPWRNRLKWWVLFGSQGDPMIEADRPTLGTLFQSAGYGTAMFGKWHVGLRYRQANGEAAAGWDDADLAQPMHTTPIDHGFDVAQFTSRSHGTSGPGMSGKIAGKRNGPNQSVGPGHIDGHQILGATGDGKQLVAEGPDAYVLTQLGSRHSDNAVRYLDSHLSGGPNAEKPFFIYYPSNSNHGPYTPDEAIGGEPVAGASRTKSGAPMDARHDYIYENDVALGRLLDYLEANDDPRNPGKKLSETTLFIFTSDNGAEKNTNIASGPFRSHKGSCYEGGHRVPFLISWADGGIGDGDADTAGLTSAAPIGLVDLFATFSEVLGKLLPDLESGEKGGEDSVSILAALQGDEMRSRPPMFYSDHKEASKTDAAVLAMRLDNAEVDGRVFPGKWKVFFDAQLVREGHANPFELYDLSTDQWEATNRLGEAELKPLVEHLSKVAMLHRHSGGHRLAEMASAERVVFEFGSLGGKSASAATLTQNGLSLVLSGAIGTEILADQNFRTNGRGLGIGGGKFDQVESGEALLISFDRDVIVEGAEIVAGNGVCGGFYEVGDHAPLAIYCIDADNDAREQQGVLSDLGVLRKGETLRLDSSPHFGVEAPGQWRLRSLAVRPLN